MDAIMINTFETLSSILDFYLVFMGYFSVVLVAVVCTPYRETTHKIVDYIYDSGNALLNWIGNTTYNLIQGTKETLALAALPFAFLAEGLWDFTKVVGKGLAISAIVLAIVMVTGLILAGAAVSFWAALPFILGYVAVRKTVSAAKAAKAKVAQMIENHKAAVAAAAEKAEAERLEQVKAEAEALGFVSGDEVAEMIKAAIAKHETEKHVEAVVEHAQAIVKKSIEDFDLASKGGRADARQYLQEQGVEVATYANRYAISKKFELLN